MVLLLYVYVSGFYGYIMNCYRAAQPDKKQKKDNVANNSAQPMSTKQPSYVPPTHNNYGNVGNMPDHSQQYYNQWSQQPQQQQQSYQVSALIQGNPGEARGSRWLQAIQ